MIGLKCIKVILNGIVVTSPDSRSPCFCGLPLLRLPFGVHRIAILATFNGQLSFRKSTISIKSPYFRRATCGERRTDRLYTIGGNCEK